MAGRLKHVDMVIEVRDARAPRSAASSHLDKIIRDAARADRRLIVVNKSDLVSAKDRAHIAGWLTKDHPGVPFFFTSAMGGNGGSKGVDTLLDAAILQMRHAAPRLFKPALDVADWPTSSTSRAISQAASAASGISVSPAAAKSLPLVMMVVGVPNVGKSSLINAFRRLATERARSSRAAGKVKVGVDRQASARSAKPARTGAKPGVTTDLHGFQVSWAPAVWMLDTPGVLTPRVDGGWEAALRLGVIDLIRYDHTSLEPIAAYALHHLARTSAGSLRRWPSVCELADRPDPAADDPWLLAGSGADAFGRQRIDHPSTALTIAATDVAEAAERRALRLLTAAAVDMRLMAKSSAITRAHGVAQVPDTVGAAQRVLKLLREGSLGPLCLDMHPPDLEARVVRSRPRRGAATTFDSRAVKRSRHRT